MMIVCRLIIKTRKKTLQAVRLNQVAKLFSYTWTFGAFLCKFVHYMQNVSAICSVLTLTAMSIERYLEAYYSLTLSCSPLTRISPDCAISKDLPTVNPHVAGIVFAVQVLRDRAPDAGPIFVHAQPGAQGDYRDVDRQPNPRHANPLDSSERSPYTVIYANLRNRDYAPQTVRCLRAARSLLVRQLSPF